MIHNALILIVQGIDLSLPVAIFRSAILLTCIIIDALLYTKEVIVCSIGMLLQRIYWPRPKLSYKLIEIDNALALGIRLQQQREFIL